MSRVRGDQFGKNIRPVRGLLWLAGTIALSLGLVGAYTNALPAA